MKEFIKAAMGRFDRIGEDNGTQFAAVLFSDRVREHFGFGDFTNLKDLHDAIDRMNTSNGGATAIGDGLDVSKIC